MTTPDIAAPAPASSSVIEDIIDIFHSPSAVFERRRTNPKFWAAFFILVVLMSAAGYVMLKNLSSVMDAQFARQAAEITRKNPQITEDQLATMRRMGETFAPVGFALTAIVSVFVLGVGVWLVGKLFESAADLRQSMVIATLASFPKLIDLLLAAVMAMTIGTNNATNMFAATPSAAHFVGSDANLAVLGALSRISIGTIWATILIAIGLQVMGRVSKQKAYTAAFVLWLFATLLTVAAAVRQG
jgi:membrane protein, antimicrobial resistance system